MQAKSSKMLFAKPEKARFLSNIMPKWSGYLHDLVWRGWRNVPEVFAH
jgi:hypothetical protein